MKSLGLQFSGLGGSHLVDGLAQVSTDMEAIENMDGVTGLSGNHLEIWFPHVAADELELGGSFLTQPVEELQGRFHLSVLSDPQQPAAPCIDYASPNWFGHTHEIERFGIRIGFSQDACESWK